jgi:hypothetical protein
MNCVPHEKPIIFVIQALVNEFPPIMATSRSPVYHVFPVYRPELMSGLPRQGTQGSLLSDDVFRAEHISQWLHEIHTYSRENKLHLPHLAGLAFSPRRSCLASGESHRRTETVYPKEVTPTLEVHRPGVSGLVPSPNGALFAGGLLDIRVWNSGLEFV